MRVALDRGFSNATFYKWRAKFGGMEASSLLAEALLDMHALKRVRLVSSLDWGVAA